MSITLISPDGERHELFYRERGSTDFTSDYTFGMTNFRGVDSAGTWTVEVRDFAGGDNGWLNFAVDKKAPGLADLLTGDKTLDEALVETSIEGLSFVPTGEFPPNPADLLMRPAYAELVEELSKRFDLVIFDCPPVLAVTDPIMIAKHASMTLVVIRYGVTMPKEVEAMQRELDASGVKVSGAIFNGFEREKSHRYGGYDYRYVYK